MESPRQIPGPVGGLGSVFRHVGRDFGVVGGAGAEVLYIEALTPDESLASRAECARVTRRPFDDYCQSVSYTHLRAHETGRNLVCRLLLEKKKKKKKKK